MREHSELEMASRSFLLYYGHISRKAQIENAMRRMYAYLRRYYGDDAVGGSGDSTNWENVR